jgi:hypothetical protein
MSCTDFEYNELLLKSLKKFSLNSYRQPTRDGPLALGVG